MAGSQGSLIIPQSSGGVAAGAVSGLLKGGDLWYPPFYFGQFHSNIVDTINALDNTARAKVIPVYLGPREVTINGLGYEITTSRSGETVLCCAYDIDNDSREPTLLLADGGVVSAGSSGIKTHSFTGVVMSGWVAFFIAATTNNIGFRALDDADVNKPNSMPFSGGSTVINDDAFYYYREYSFTLGTAGAEADPPADLSEETIVGAGAGEMPLIYFSVE